MRSRIGGRVHASRFTNASIGHLVALASRVGFTRSAEFSAERDEGSVLSGRLVHQRQELLHAGRLQHGLHDLRG